MDVPQDLELQFKALQEQNVKLRLEIRRLRACAQRILSTPEDARRVAGVMLTGRVDGMRNTAQTKIRVPALTIRVEE